jgi:DNA-binding MarR family transcriptional regulator
MPRYPSREALKLATAPPKKPRAFDPCAEELAYLDLLRTSDLLARPVAAILKSADLSSTQYNVLRILRGSPEGLPCGEIAGRMITRDPDITRLLDRLEKRALISRERATYDRRTVVTQITPAGLALLATLDKPVREAHRHQLSHLGPARLRQLSRLLRLARGA